MISRSTVQRAPATEVRRAPATEHACYRINDSRQPGASVFVLSGELDTGHTERLQELLASAAGRTSLDLKEITLVDRAAVRYLASVEMAGTEIVNCPEYVRSWIAAENESW